MTKQLLIEDSGFISQIKISKALSESISVAQGKNNTLVVKNVPCTICNRLNQNGRNYSTKEMQKAIDNAQEAIRTKQLLCQADEHPEGSWVAPTHASHVVTNAYIKPNVSLVVEGKKGTFDVLFMDWEVLNTQEGRNLQALLLSECSLGTSIRGLGDMDGDNVINYELLGVDVVNNPSSGTYTRMPVKESIKVELKKENALDEATKFTVSTYASNTTHDLQQAMDFQKNASATVDYGTIVNMGTKMDQEIDPKTGVSKTIGEVEIETSDDMSELRQAIEVAVTAFTNPQGVNVNSVTIEKVDEDDEMNDSTEQEPEHVLQEEEGVEEMPVEDVTEEITTDEVSMDDLAGNEELVLDDGETLEETAEELKADTWIKTSLLDPAAVYYVAEVTEEYVILRKHSETGKDIILPRDDGMLFPYEYVKDEEETEEVVEEAVGELDGEADVDSDIEVDGDTVTATVDTGSETIDVEKEFPSEEDASMVASGVKTGKISPDVLMSDSAEECEAKVCPHCGEKLDCCDEDKCEEENAVEEKLYAEPDAPSDAFVQEPMNEEGDIVIKLGNLDYDIDKESFEDWEPETIELVEGMPETVEITINPSEVTSVDMIEDLIMDKARQQTGLPIKGADVVDAWVKDEATIIEVA